MPLPTLMRKLSPFSLLSISEHFSGIDKIAQLLPLMPLDYLYEVHDFQAALDAAQWTAPTAGTAPTAFAYNEQRTGALRGATGTTANNVIALHKTQTYFDAADRPLMVVRWRAPAAVTAFHFEIMFSDPKTAEAAVSITDVDVPTVGNGVTDCVAVVMDTSQTLTTAALVGEDGGGGPAVRTNIGAWTPTANNWTEMVIGVERNRGFCSVVDGGRPIGRFSVSNGPNLGVLLRPSLVFRTLNTTSKQIDIDLIILAAERNA